MTTRTIYSWLERCDFLFAQHSNAEYKDGALFDDVLDDLFNRVLPDFARLTEQGLLIPDDFIGVTDEVDGKSMQAYEKARLRAISFKSSDFPEGDPSAVPFLSWSHDEACASSMDAQVNATQLLLSALFPFTCPNSHRRARGSSGAKVPSVLKVTQARRSWQPR